MTGENDKGMLRAFLCYIIAGIVCMSLLITPAYATDEQTVTITLTIDSQTYTRNGESLSLDVPPYISQDNRTMVPIRFIAEGFGAQVRWYDEGKTDYIELLDKYIGCTVGEKLPDNMGTPVIKNDRLFVPVRYIAENFGAQVDWDAATRKITIVSPKLTYENILKYFTEDLWGDIIDRVDTDYCTFLYIRQGTNHGSHEFLVRIDRNGAYKNYADDFKSVSLWGTKDFRDVIIKDEKVFLHYDVDYVIDLKSGVLSKT